MLKLCCQDYVFPPYTVDKLPKRWSGCSVQDFKVAYQLNKNIDKVYCLEREETDLLSIVGDQREKDCVDLKLTTAEYAHEIHWSFGSCCSKQQYEDNKEYDIKCCQPAGI